MNLRQFFCRHIYKTIKITPTRKEFEFMVGAWQYYAERQECMKCGHRRLVEKRYMSI